MKLSKKSKLFIIVYGLLGLLIVAMVLVVYQTREESKELFANGIRVEASVTRLYESTSGTRRNKSHQYFVDVAFFTGVNKVVVKPKSDNIVDKIAAISEEAVANAKLGDYHTARISIRGEDFVKYKEGDKVTVIYLKGKESEAHLVQ